MSSRRATLLTTLLLTAALFCAMPQLFQALPYSDTNRMDQRLRPASSRTLTVWVISHSSTSDRKLINELCAAFEKQEKGVRVFLRTVTTLELAAENTVLPDAVLYSSGTVLMPEQFFLPLVAPDRLPAAVLSCGKSSLQLYGIPLWYSPNVLSIPRTWLADDDEPTPTPKPSSFFNLQTPSPALDDQAIAPYLMASDLPWDRLLTPGALILSDGVSLQQLLSICPAQLRGELISGCQAAATASTTTDTQPARIQTLSQHLSAASSGQGVIACPLTPATCDSIRSFSLCKDTEDARAFLSFLLSDVAASTAIAHHLLPTVSISIASDALTNALFQSFQNGCLFPNVFAHTNEELDSLCLDAFMRNLDPTETLLRLR